MDTCSLNLVTLAYFSGEYKFLTADISHIFVGAQRNFAVPEVLVARLVPNPKRF